MHAAERFCSGTSHAGSSWLHTGATPTLPPTWKVGAILFTALLCRLIRSMGVQLSRAGYGPVPPAFLLRRVDADSDTNEAVEQRHAVQVCRLRYSSCRTLNEATPNPTSISTQRKAAPLSVPSSGRRRHRCTQKPFLRTFTGVTKTAGVYSKATTVAGLCCLRQKAHRPPVLPTSGAYSTVVGTIGCTDSSPGPNLLDLPVVEQGKRIGR